MRKNNFTEFVIPIIVSIVVSVVTSLLIEKYLK